MYLYVITQHLLRLTFKPRIQLVLHDPPPHTHTHTHAIDSGTHYASLSGKERVVEVHGPMAGTSSTAGSTGPDASSTAPAASPMLVAEAFKCRALACDNRGGVDHQRPARPHARHPPHLHPTVAMADVQGQRSLHVGHPTQPPLRTWVHLLVIKIERQSLFFFSEK